MQASIKNYIVILFLASALFIPSLGNVHLFDWDEINFAECAREMIVTENYSTVQINFLPFWEKPPLFIWMQVVSMKIFGINEFAARLPNALCGILTLLLLYHFGKKEKDETFGLLWALVYIGSFLPHFYFKSGIIDPWFNLFIFGGLIYWHSFIKSPQASYIIISALFTAAAILTKGPVALLVTFISVIVYWGIKCKFSKGFIQKRFLLLYFITLIIAGSSWFIAEIINGNSHIISAFINYQIRLVQTEDSGHGGPFYYHFVVLLLGCFPASILALKALNKKNIFTSPDKLNLWMLILLVVVLLIFSVVKTKIVHYSSLAYFPLTFFAALFCYSLIRNEEKWNYRNKIIFLITGVIISVVLIAPQFIDKYKLKIINSELIKDEFAKNNLAANVNWQGTEFLIGLTLLIIVVLFVSGYFKTTIKTISAFFVASALCINAALTIIVPKIEGYSQGAAVNFYKKLQHEDCYIETLGFKSYAHLFYAQTKETANKEKMLNEKTNKPCYFVCKINRAQEYTSSYPNLKELYRENGFVFFVKE